MRESKNPILFRSPDTLFLERTGAISRASEQLERFLAELEALERELDRLQLTLDNPTQLPQVLKETQTEMDLLIDEYNHLREAAANNLRRLIHLRESCGFRQHDLLQRCFPIPELLLPSLPETLLNQ
jgi:hypothetical protein